DFLDQVLFVGRDDMSRARVHQGLPLRAGAGQGDGSRTRPVGDLDGGQADAARGRGDHERIARLQVGDVDQGSVAGQVLHPDRGRLLPRERGGVMGHGMGRVVHEVAVDPVLVHGEGRNGADRIADLEPVAPRADGGNRPGRLTPDAGRELGLIDVLAPAEHRLSAIEPQRLDSDLDLALPGRRDVELLDLQDLGSAGLVESYYPCHGVLLLTVGVCGFALHNQAFGTAKLNGTTPLPARAGLVKGCAYALPAPAPLPISRPPRAGTQTRRS